MKSVKRLQKNSKIVTQAESCGVPATLPTPSEIPNFMEIGQLSASTRRRQLKDRALKVAAISDTHQHHGAINLPPADVLVCAGDVCLEGTMFEFDGFAEWWNSLEYRYKVLVPGNHDWCFQKKEGTCRAWLPDTIVLIDQLAEIEGRIIWGSPYTPWFYNWAYNVPRGMLHEHWDKIPINLDLLITHGPPHGVLDQARPMLSENLGDNELRHAVEQKKPARHVFGHIHGSGGRLVKVGDTAFHNISVVNEQYKVVRGAEEFTI